MPAQHIHIDGVVQGVGFRPFVYRLAHAHGLAGWVRNNSQGVDIQVMGPLSSLDAFARDLEIQAPPLARVQAIIRRPITEQDFNGEFHIMTSQEEPGFTLVSPDVATCSDCLQELFDPQNRRYRYPFINCTNCGPRFSIIRSLPYDRHNTTMATFHLCNACQDEYNDPLNRRFHAQPNACPHCGPHIWFEATDILFTDEAQALQAANQWLKSGHILAIKGLGGFHLACDATNERIVQALRKRKSRPHKPLAVMMRDMDMVRDYCKISLEEEALLTSSATPILLLEPKSATDLATGIAPGQRSIGVMLPYTPLHHILLRDINRPLVMTSGNRQNEPIARTNEEARTKLGHLADAFLWHNRQIHNRIDDSVWMVTADGPTPIRRSRGEAPRPIELAIEATDPILAIGSQMKNTFCILIGSQAFLSQHIGEMDDVESWDFFTESVYRYRELFGAQPKIIAHDLHPDFTLTAMDALETLIPNARAVPIQHHHAHVASCLAENQASGPAIGLALDGTGYGPDGTIWGGEILVADLKSYRRVGRLEPFHLPGNEAAIHQPVRISLGLLLESLGQLPPNLDVVQRTHESLRRAVTVQLRQNLNAPSTSSCGRFFDATAALLGLRDTVTYEGQAAIELETLAAPHMPIDPYPVQLDRTRQLWQLPTRGIFREMTSDILWGAPPAEIAARFHATLIALLFQLAQRLRQETGINQIALSGGCFQNRILLEGLLHALRVQDFTVLTHHQVPTNDGGISLGQAAIAAAHITAGQ